MGEAVYISAQEAAERLLTIKIAGWLVFFLIIFAGVWLFIVWKYSEDRRREEVENDAARIAVTKTIGKDMTNALKDDGNWKERFFTLKAQYDVLEAHCANMESILDSAQGKNGFLPKRGVAK